MKCLGFGPNYGNSWLYIYAWEAGGEFMNLDRTRVTLDRPEIIRALRFMADVYDDVGGFKQADAFQQSFQQNEMDPFLRGLVAMKIDGDWSLANIADYKRDMDFVISPAPMPEDQLRPEGALPNVERVDFALARARRRLAMARSRRRRASSCSTASGRIWKEAENPQISASPRRIARSFAPAG